MIEHILEFICYQHKLVSLFNKTYPKVQDIKYLFDFPKRGNIKLVDEDWLFIKHGIGIRFTRLSPQPQIVIDVHDNFAHSNIISSWRILLYLESIGIDKEEESIIIILENMVKKGLLKKTNKEKYYSSSNTTLNS